MFYALGRWKKYCRATQDKTGNYVAEPKIRGCYSEKLEVKIAGIAGKNMLYGGRHRIGDWDWGCKPGCENKVKTKDEDDENYLK